MLSVALTAFVSLFSLVAASPCVIFDAQFNLLVFGANGKDFSLGQQDSWTGSGSVTDITANGRPPFDGDSTTCYMAQFFNAIYVFNGDKAHPTNVAVYDATAKSWTTQATSVGDTKFSYSNFDAILDHDTNDFYALSGGELFRVGFGSITAGNSTALTWEDVKAPSFSTTNYQPVMALAQNHVHFLNVPGAQAGTAQIFVIHFAFFQPDAQAFKVDGSGSDFPVTNGQAFSLFQPDGQGVQQEFVFIPTDGSQTYVVNVESNTTQVLSGPSSKSSSSLYTAGVTSIVQLTSDGQIFFLPYQEGKTSNNVAASWTKVSLNGLPSFSTGSNSSSGSSSGGSSDSGTATKGSSGSGTNTAGSASQTGASAIGAALSRGLIALIVALGVTQM